MQDANAGWEALPPRTPEDRQLVGQSCILNLVDKDECLTVVAHMCEAGMTARGAQGDSLVNGEKRWLTSSPLIAEEVANPMHPGNHYYHSNHSNCARKFSGSIFRSIRVIF